MADVALATQVLLLLLLLPSKVDFNFFLDRQILATPPPPLSSTISEPTRYPRRGLPFAYVCVLPALSKPAYVISPSSHHEVIFTFPMRVTWVIVTCPYPRTDYSSPRKSESPVFVSSVPSLYTFNSFQGLKESCSVPYANNNAILVVSVLRSPPRPASYGSIPAPDDVLTSSANSH